MPRLLASDILGVVDDQPPAPTSFRITPDEIIGPDVDDIDTITRQPVQPSPPPAPPRTSFTEQTIDFAKGMASGVSSVFGGLAGAVDAARDAPQIVPGQRALAETLQPITGAVRRADTWVQEAMRPPDDLLGDVRQRPELLTNPRWWASGGGQVVGSAAPYLLSGGAGAASTFVPGVIEAMTEGGAAYNDAIAAGRSPEEAAVAASKVAGANAALIAVTNKLGYGVGKAITPVIARRGAQVITEAGQEAGQEAIGNVAAGRPVGEGVANALVLGGIGGAAIGDTRDAAVPPLPMRARPPIPLAPQARSIASTPSQSFPPPLAPQGGVAPQTQRLIDDDILGPVAASPAPSNQVEKPEVEAPVVKQSGQISALRSVDTLDTGEQQPRIPGAEDVRNQEQPTPEFDAPFSLTPQAAPSTSVQPSLVEEPPPAPRDTRPFLQRAADDAVAQGYRGTAEDAAADIARRARDLHEAEQGAVAHTPKALLQAIRDVGGIQVTDDDLGGELRRLKEFKDPRTVNQIAGVQGVFRRRGRTLDDMAVELSRMRGWTDINTPAALVDAIENAAIAAREGRAELPKFDVEHYAMGAGVKPGTRWWVGKPANRFTTLPAAETEIQERAARALEDDFEGHVGRYGEQFGNVINADNASELFPDYAASKESRARNVRAVRAPAGSLVEEVYQRKLAEPTPEGKPGLVVFTGGGNGSGKSSSITPTTRAEADVIFDSTMSQVEPTKTKVNAALDTGRFVELRYVYRDPVAAFERGVLPRALATGRTVPIRHHVQTHIDALKTIRALAEVYADEPGVGVKVFESVEGGGLVQRDLDWLESLEYPDPNALRAQLEASLARADVPAAIREGTALPEGSQRPPDEGRPRTLPESRRGEPESDRRGDRGTFPPTLSESRAPSDRARVPVPLKSTAATPARVPAKLRADLDEGLGSPTRRVFEEGPEAIAGATPPKKPISESQAVARLQTIFGHDKPPTALERMGLRTRQRTPLPTKTGRFRERAFGVYKIEPQVIRLKRFGDLATFTHELGHHIDFGIFGEENRPGGALFADELLRLGANTSSSSAPKSIRMAEGVAEFFRLYFPNPDKARQAAPQFFRAFEDVLAGNPAMARQFAEGQRVVQSYLAQDLATRGAARVDRSRREVDEDPRTLTQRLEVQWVDDLADLRRAVEDLSADKPVPYKENAYVLARLARGAAGKASGFLEFGPRRDDGTFLGGSFADAIAPVRGRLKDFSEFLVASRVPELRGRGIETGMTAREAEAIRTKHGSPEFEQARDALYAYQNAVLEYAVQGGALSRSLADKIKLLNQHYVPFHRLLSTDVRPGVARRIADRTLPIKKIRGSGADIVDPLESIIKNTHAIVDMVEKNKAMRALVKQATSTTGGGQFIEAIPQPKVATKFNLDQLRGTIRDVLRDANLAVKSVRDVEGDYIEVEGQAVNLDEFVTVFTPAAFSLPGQDLVTVIDGGKRSFYAVNDKALYQAITQMGAKPASIVVALLGAPARALRAGATLTLGFIGRNPVRDTFAATVQSKYGFKPGVDTLRGLFRYLKKDEAYQQFLNSGAAGAALVSGDRKVLQRELRKYAAEGKLTDHLKDVVAHPIDALRALSEATEVATRLGEFMKAVRTEGRTEEGFARAGLAARDITVDFSRAGTEGRTWNQYAAFLNARIQGYARLVETFRTNPVGATVRATAAITAMSIAAWALNHDDEEWRELPEWEKSTYWHIRNPAAAITGEPWIRIPKPFELGAVFGTFFEKALDHVTANDPHAFKRLFLDDPNGDVSKLPLQAVKNSAWSVIQAITPTAILPIIEAQANYSTFRDRAIVSPFDADLEPALQYNRWTSETAKAIGKALDYPPAKIDHLIYGYGAGLARGVVGGVEGATKRVMGGASAPSARASDLPGVGAFARDVAGSDAESLAEFYRRRDALEGAARSGKRYKEQRDSGELARLRSKFPTIDTDRRRFRQAAEDLKDLRDQVDAVFKDTKLEADAKRDRLDRLYERMVNTARVALGKKALPSRFTSAAVPVRARP